MHTIWNCSNTFFNSFNFNVHLNRMRDLLFRFSNDWLIIILAAYFCSSQLFSQQIRIAIDDASNLESTTKKWLSMMAKDCNRFCKIMVCFLILLQSEMMSVCMATNFLFLKNLLMESIYIVFWQQKSTENKGASPIPIRKQRKKKITFADEAGGLLCHVKVFEQLSTPSKVRGNDNSRAE